MKRILMCAAACLACVSGTWAQSDDFFAKPDKNGRDKVFYGSIVLGMNAAQIDGDTYSGYHKAGLNAGVAAFVKFHPKLLGSIELLYAQKGARDVNLVNSPAVGTLPLEYNAKLNYVEIPVMFNYLVYDRLHFGLGGTYARLISDKEYMDSYTGGAPGTLENTFRKQDINAAASLMYRLYGNIFVRVRYQYSVKSIRDVQQIPIEFSTAAQYNNLFAFHILCIF